MIIMKDINSNIESLLKKSGIRITAVRLLIWKTIHKEFSGVFSLADLEEKLPTVDKSTLFRTLNIFSAKALLDNIDDGTGSQKYCICNVTDRSQNRRHIHFNCKVCHKTECLTDIVLPEVVLPEGYIVEDTEYVVKGICCKCARKLLN